MEITENSAKEIWKKALKYVLENGSDLTDSAGRVSREVLRLSLTLEGFSDIKDPVETLANSKKWLYPRPKEIEAIMLERDLGKSYVYSYGERIFSFSKEGINQIDNYLIPLLKKDKKNRRGIITLWDPEKDCNLDKSVVPGLVTIDVKVRNNKILMTAVVRSNDIYIGWPANLYQLYCLARYIAERIDCEIGSITTFSTSAHIFKENMEEIKEITSK